MFPPSVAPGLARPHALTHRTRDDRAEGTWAGDLTCHSPTLSDTHADSAGGGSSGPRLPRPAEHACDCVPLTLQVAGVSERRMSGKRGLGAGNSFPSMSWMRVKFPGLASESRTGPAL